MAVTCSTIYKNWKNHHRFYAHFFNLFRKVMFLCSLFIKKNSSQKSRKKWEKTSKTEKIRKNTINFSIFGKIFQSFRKSYVLVPSHGERKWRRKSDKKNPYGRVFGKSSKKHTKNRNFERKKVLSERSLREKNRFSKSLHIRQNAVIWLKKIANFFKKIFNPPIFLIFKLNLNKVIL